MQSDVTPVQPRSPTPYGVTRPQWVKLKGELLTLTLEDKDLCLKVTSKDYILSQCNTLYAVQITSMSLEHVDNSLKIYD